MGPVSINSRSLSILGYTEGEHEVAVFKCTDSIILYMSVLFAVMHRNLLPWFHAVG